MEMEERDFYRDFDMADDFSLCSFSEARDLSMPILPESYRMHEVKVILSDEPMIKSSYSAGRNRTTEVGKSFRKNIMYIPRVGWREGWRQKSELSQSILQNLKSEVKQAVAGFSTSHSLATGDRVGMKTTIKVDKGGENK
jgi:hypothetical protein